MTTLTLADGQTIACAQVGSGSPVVCVPGGPARAAAYLGDLGGLDATVTLHVLDNRGSGGSRPTDLASVSVERLARDLIEVIGLLGLRRPTVLSHSFGARVVAKALELQPDLARAVVFVTPGPLVVDPAGFADARTALLDLRADDAAYAEAVEAARALPTARPRDQSLLSAASVPLWYGRWGPEQQAHAAAQRSQVDARTAMTLRNDSASWTPPDVSRVSAPVLVVAGSLDFLCPPPVARAVQGLFARSAYVEIEGAGHFPWVDDAATFAATVADFLGAQGLA